jgi:hypothetical protein
MGGCTGANYPRSPITFSWSCVPAVDEKGCPSDAPTIGTPCERTTVCGYPTSPIDSCGHQVDFFWRSCWEGHWDDQFHLIKD